MAQHNANLLVSGTVTVPSGIYTDSLTVSGVPVDIAGGGATADPLNIGTINVSSSLTISGVPVATGTGPFYTLFSMGDSTVFTSTDGVEEKVNNFNEIRSDTGGFTVSDGTITTPDEYTHIRMTGQIWWQGVVTPAGSRRYSFFMNGRDFWLDNDTGLKVAQTTTRSPANPSPNNATVMQILSPVVAVSGGTQFDMRVRHVGFAATAEIEAGGDGDHCFMQIEGFKS